MKQRWIWISGGLILALLIIRTFLNHKENVRKERTWYIKELDFQFSAVVDTVIPSGKILFHVTHGDLDRNKEKRTRHKLHYNGMLDLFLYKSNRQVELMINDAEKIHRGDSIYLNSVKNLVRIYRNNELLVQRDLLGSLRGRPF